MIKKDQAKIIIIVGSLVSAFLLHYYDALFIGIMGHSHFLHATHGRLLYLPIVLGAIWFGLRGGLVTSAAVTLIALPYIFIKPVNEIHDLIAEYADILFYFALALLAGILVDKERLVRKNKEEAERKLKLTERLWVMGQMAASIAHEVKNPLVAIGAAAHLLQDSTLSSGEKAEFAAIIEKESIHANKIISDYLSYARPAPPEISEIDIESFLQSIRKRLFSQATTGGIKINVNIEESEIKIRGDEDKLHQAIINIVINAIQAMTKGGKINITCGMTAVVPAPWIRIDICDDGPGISADVLPLIFNPFFSTKAQGTGLGLSITREIIEEHKGKIEVVSSTGKGTCFRIALPVNERVN